jgi:hypothetical protein
MSQPSGEFFIGRAPIVKNWKLGDLFPVGPAPTVAILSAAAERATTGMGIREHADDYRTQGRRYFRGTPPKKRPNCCSSSWAWSRSPAQENRQDNEQETAA